MKSNVQKMMSVLEPYFTGGLSGIAIALILLAIAAKSFKDADRYYALEHRVTMLELKGENNEK